MTDAGPASSSLGHGPIAVTSRLSTRAPSPTGSPSLETTPQDCASIDTVQSTPIVSGQAPDVFPVDVFVPLKSAGDDSSQLTGSVLPSGGEKTVPQQQEGTCAVADSCQFQGGLGTRLSVDDRVDGGGNEVYDDTECIAMETQLSNQNRSRKQKPTAMELSEQEVAAVKLSAKEEEAIICLKPANVTKHSPPSYVTRQLARGLHEPKVKLLRKVVDVLGTKRAMELFHETAEIQLSGGHLSVDGMKKRSPGGVFLTLVKRIASAEQRKEIFTEDKKICMAKKHFRKKQKSRQAQVLIPPKALNLSPGLPATPTPDISCNEPIDAGRKSVFERISRRPCSDTEPYATSVVEHAAETMETETVAVSANGFKVQCVEATFGGVAVTFGSEGSCLDKQTSGRGQALLGADLVATEEKLAEEFEMLHNVDAPGLELD